MRGNRDGKLAGCILSRGVADRHKFHSAARGEAKPDGRMFACGVT